MSLLLQICKCFPFGEAEEEPSLRNNRTRVKIDRTMIGNPTDFRHTVHGTGGGNLQVCVRWPNWIFIENYKAFGLI